MPDVTQTQGIDQAPNAGEHLVAVLSVHHAKEVVGPVRQTARALVAQRHAVDVSKLPADAVHPRVGHIPHHHRVGAVAQFVMADHHAQALDDAGVDHRTQPCDDGLLADSQALSDRPIGPRDQRQSSLDGLDKVLGGPAHGFVDDVGCKPRACRAGRGGGRVSGEGHAEAEIDVVIPYQRQRERGVARARHDPCECIGERGLVRRRHHEPQVVAVLAFVIVVHLGEIVDDAGHLLQLRGRHLHGGERAGADGVGAEYGAYAAHRALPLQLREARQHRRRAGVEAPRDLRERRRRQREVVLKVVEQAFRQRFHG
jgi:hypothetical protein